MTDEMNPEIERTLDELADLFCKSMNGELSDLGERQDGLLKALVMNGYVRLSEGSLMSEVEGRVKNKYSKPFMSRGAELSSMTSKLEARFKSLALWESGAPVDVSPRTTRASFLSPILQNVEVVVREQAADSETML